MITEPIWEHIKRDHLVGRRSIFVREMDCQKLRRYNLRLEITRATSSSTVSVCCGCLCAPITGFSELGGPYTLGKDGALPEVGLDVAPVSVVEAVGDGGGRREDCSEIRDREKVKSRD